MEVSREYVEGYADKDDPSSRWACFVYELRADGEMLFGRQWEHSPAQAEFVHWTDGGGTLHTFRSVPYDRPLFRDATRYFLEEQGVRHVTILLFTQSGVSPTWCPVELSKFAEQAAAPDRPRE